MDMAHELARVEQIELREACKFEVYVRY